MSDWKNVQYKDGKYRTSEGGGGGSSTFAGLDDVSFNNIQNGQVPKYNSTTQKWENANESGGGGTVTDVQVDGTSVVNQQGVAEIETPNAGAIEYDNQQSGLSATDVQEAIDELATSGGVGALSDLSDVQLNNLTDHQPLRYDATIQKWRNGADSYPPLIYSDEEREVGVWRDGKPLYQKTLIIPNTVIDNTGAQTYQHGISNIEECVSIRGYIQFSTGGIQGGRTQKNDWDLCNAIYGFSPTQIYMNIGKTWNESANKPAKILATIQYTKTTDTAGSGTWTTQGGYAHHYSTTEQVVGTWVNGKPLYAKSYDTVHISANQSVEVDSFDQSIITIIKMDFTWNVGWAVSSNAHYWSAQSVGINGYNESSDVSGPRVYVQENKLRFKNNSGGGAGIDIRGTIYYTKTTD